MAESPTPFAEIDLGPSKLDQFLDAHQKKLIALAILLALGVIAYVIYSGIAQGEAEDAGAALLTSEKTEDYQKVIDQWPTSQSAATALPLMADIQATDSPEKAIETLRSFLDANAEHPTAATAKVSLALLLLKQEKADEANTLLNEVADSDSYIAPLACITLGDAAKASGNKEEATSWYQKAQEDSGEQGNAYKDAAAARLALVNAKAPVKIKPAPPAPEVPEAPAAIPATNITPAAPVVPAITPVPAPAAPKSDEEPAPKADETDKPVSE